MDGAALVLTVSFLLFNSAAYAWCLCQLARLGVSRALLLAAFVVWAFFPVFPGYSRWIVKDSPAATLFLVFVTQVVVRLRVLAEGRTPPRYSGMVAVTLVSVLCCLTRNDSAHVVVPTLLLLAWWGRGKARLGARTLAVPVVVVACLVLWNVLLLPALGVGQTNSREALSLPLQMTARYLSVHPDDVSDEEREAVESAATTTLEEIASSYNPDKSDRVKAYFNFEGEGASFARYFEAWLSMGARHPGTYLTSLLRGTYGYWYPFADVYTWREADYRVTPEGYHVFSESMAKWNDIEEAWLSEVGSFGELWSPGLYDALVDFCDFVRFLPVVCLLFTPASWVWAASFLLGYLAHRRGPALVLAAPMLLKWLVCVASPLSSSMRYALPIVACAPVLLAAAVVLRPQRGGPALAAVPVDLARLERASGEGDQAARFSSVAGVKSLPN